MASDFASDFPTATVSLRPKMRKTGQDDKSRS